MQRILESISRRTLAGGAVCLLISTMLVLPSCGEEDANEALRELVGRWQLDVGESLKRSLSGLIDTGFDPSRLGSQEIERMEREVPFELEITRTGVVAIHSTDTGESFVGVVEDTGTLFRVKFDEQGEFVGRMTLELERTEDLLNARIITLEAEGENLFKQLSRFRAFGAPYFVFRQKPEGMR